MKFTLDEIVKSTDAKILKNTSNTSGFSFSTDTRSIKNGEIYIPLKGENFDGEKFIQNALDKGAIGYFTTKNEFINAEIVLKVEDTQIAYLKMARFLRNKIAPKTIAVTGSSGKTTTKEMIYSTVNEKFKTHKTALNHNNEVGFCQTVFSMPEDCEVLIIEMGMRGFGEIDLLSKYAQADIAVIANVGTAHIGRLGSRENIAKAKLEVTNHLKSDGILISHNDELIKKTSAWMGKTIYYSVDEAVIKEKKVGFSKFVYKGAQYELNVEGNYNIENSIAAIEVGLSLQMSVEEIRLGLKKYSPIEKRWESEEVNGFTVINDSYNANPESMKAAVSTFLELYPSPVVVLGDMGELGDDETKFHQEVGEFLGEKAQNIKNVKFLTVGKLAREAGEELRKKAVSAISFDTTSQVSRYIVENIEKSTTIFLKASRSMKFEEIIEEMRTHK